MPMSYGTGNSPNGSPLPALGYTMEEAIEKLGFGCLQLRIYLACKLVVATDALEIMLLSLVGPEVKCYWQLQDSQVAFISTAVFCGMAVSSPLWGILADHYGRRACLLMTTMITAYFGLLASFAPTYIWFLLLRGLVGFGMGGVPQGYALVAEYVPSKCRAKMIVFSEVFWALGSLFEILIAALVTPSLGWRWLVGISSLPVFVAIIACVSIPESARYLVAAGKKDQALIILQRLSISNGQPLPLGTLVTSKTVSLARVRDLFSSEYRLSTILLWPIWFVVSFAYYGIVLASPYLLSDQTSTEDSDAQCTVLTTGDYVSLATSTLGEIAGLVFSFLLIDRIGRRWTWRLLMLAASAFLFLLQIPGSSTLTTFLIFGVRGSTLTAFNLCFIYTVELYPTSTRALGLGLCNTWSRLACMVTPFLAQVLMLYSVPVTVTIYGILCLLIAVVMFFLPVETKGRPMMLPNPLA
ncbi:hypothetical protein ACOMHN_019406 [Nucella lapillus]